MPTSMLQHPALSAAILLIGSNLFMTFAWYGRLRNMQSGPWWIAATVSWGIALFEYLWAALCLVGAAYFIFRA
jgi:uncharacterized protein